MNQKRPFHTNLYQLRRLWLPIVVAGFAALLLLVDSPGWAAPSPERLHQTVPRPTPTPENTPVPTATPDSGDSSDRDSDSEGAADDTGDLLQAEVISTEATLYEQANTESTALGTLFAGEIVDMLARNERNTWWAVCCLAGSETQGWVDAQFLEPNQDLATIGSVLPVVQSSAQTLPEETVGEASDAQEAATDDRLPTSGLELAMEQDPPFVWQGNLVELIFTVTNSSQSEAVEVEIRDHLPAELTFVDAQLSNDGNIERASEADGSMILTINWDSLPAEASAQALVTLRVTEDLADGAIIDNLSYADARNALGQTAGISIGMPPNTLPDFR